MSPLRSSCLRRLFPLLWILLLPCWWALGFQALSSSGRTLSRTRWHSQPSVSVTPSCRWGLLTTRDDTLEDTTHPEAAPSTTTSWIPRLAFVVVSLFQHNHSASKAKDTTMTNNESTHFVGSSPSTQFILNGDDSSLDSMVPPFTTVNVSLAAAKAVVKSLENVSQQGLEGNEMPLSSTKTDDAADDDDDDLTQSNQPFFSMPSSNATNDSGIMWNLTQDLVIESEAKEDQSILLEEAKEVVVNIKDTSTTDEKDPVSMDSCSFERTDAQQDFEMTVASDDERAKLLDKFNQTTALLEGQEEEKVSLPMADDSVAVSQKSSIHEPAPVSVDQTISSSGSSATENIVKENDREESIRRRAAEISHSFYAKEFQPAWFAKNSHLQTIVGVKARQESMYFPTTGNLILSNFEWDYRQRVESYDGDFFDVDWKYTNKVPAKHDNDSLQTPVVLICHGLQSNTNSPLTKDMTIAFNNVGMDVAAINFRGCSGEPNRTPMGYHLSYTEDLELIVRQISRGQPGRPIYLSGFSLGANVVTKFLADVGIRAAEEYNIYGAAVNAVPFDLTKCQAINQPGFSGSVYGDNLLRSLKDRTLKSMETGVVYKFTREELERCTTIKEFDNLVVCSVYDDFEDADDYHRKSSTRDRLSEIMVPQLILQALDDPFFIGNDNPENNPNLPCRIQYTKHGGHCGYVFHAEERDKRGSSFMPTELARFVEHVHHVRKGQKSTIVPRRTQPQTQLTAHGIQMELAQASVKEKYRREQAAIAANSFEPRDFVPAEWARNEHFQTIMGALFRRQTMYVNNSTETPNILQSFLTKHEFQWDDRQRMETPDGDFFDVDWKFVRSDDHGSKRNNPLVLICHGLQSDSSSPLAQDMAQAFNNIGMDAACINFRGCSGQINETPVGYHLGFTDDLKQMVDHLNLEYPNRRIYLSGFSLGANVVTTCLAELGEQAYEKNIFGAAVNAVPFDMLKAHRNLNNFGITKSLYGGRLLASMIARVEQAYDKIEFPFPREEAAKCRTIMDMENLVIAPIFGFRDAYDYYEKASSLQKIDRVAVPELVISSEDDPFFFGQSSPQPDSSRPLRLHMTKNGGHCGYVFHAQEEENYKTSWMPTELARFLVHLEETFSSQFDPEMEAGLQHESHTSIDVQL